MSPVYYSFPQLPQWEFKVDCVFSPYDLPYGLFSLTDFVPHFVVRSNKMNRAFRKARWSFGCEPTMVAHHDNAGKIPHAGLKLRSVRRAEAVVCGS